MFKFEPSKEYTIKIHAFKYYNYYSTYETRFRYVKYYILPFTKDNFKVITGDEEFFFSKVPGPMLGFVQPNLNQTFTMVMGSILKENIFLVAKTLETIEPNLENIFTKMQDLKFSDNGALEVVENEPYTTIAFIVPAELESRMKFYLINDMIEECKDSYLIPANKNTMIVCDDEKEFESFNNITTFISDKKNMH